MYKYLAKQKPKLKKEINCNLTSLVAIAKIHLLRDYTKLAISTLLTLNKRIKNYNTKLLGV